MIKVLNVNCNKDNNTYMVMFDNGMTISGIDKSLALVPSVGMEFDSVEDIFAYMTSKQDK